MKNKEPLSLGIICGFGSVALSAAIYFAFPPILHGLVWFTDLCLGAL